MTVTYDVAGGSRSGFLRDLRDIARDYLRYRELLRQFVLRDIRIRYKQAVMGFGWALLMPVLIVMSGMIVRYAMARLSGGEVAGADLAAIAVKALPWSFFVGAVGFANASLVGNANLVTKIYFPREVLPIGSVVAQGFDGLVSMAALVVFLPFLGAKLSMALLWVPLLLILLFLFTAACALFLSAANLFFRDVKYIVQVLLTYGIFFTPVFYEPAMLGAKGARLVLLNPIAPLLEGLRFAIVDGHNLGVVRVASDGVVAWTPANLAYSAAWSLVGFVVASVLFHRLEQLFAEYV